jgi:hypothetical protein
MLGCGSLHAGGIMTSPLVIPSSSEFTMQNPPALVRRGFLKIGAGAAISLGVPTLSITNIFAT